ncbi:MAG: sensor histidine kinase [Bacillota bacterium]
MIHKIGKSNSASFSDKVRSSLVLKLNVRMLGSILAAFLSFNIILSFLFIGITIWRAEENSQKFISSVNLDRIEETTNYFADYEITKTEITEGVLLPVFLQERLPWKNVKTRRSIATPGFNKPMSPQEWVGQVTYTLYFTRADDDYQLMYAIGSDLRSYLFVMVLLLAWELFYFLGRIRKNNRTIRRTLKPLSDLAKTTQKLQDEIADINSSTSGDKLKDLAGAISTIDAEKLDRQISVDSSQDELKTLAHAINDMLKRINQAYQSQIRFVSDASHELRTPISVIQGYVSLLDRWGKNDEQTLEESIAAIKTETENMKMLVEHLLFLARGDNEAIQLHKTEFDSCQLIEEIIRETSLFDESHKISTELEGPIYLDADRQLIKQALRILIDNSLKYTPEGEEVRLVVKRDKENVIIQVQDNGIGIKPEDVPHIFDRFYRSDESRARKTGGSGLGLAIARWIIERHDGHFEVLSRVDIGTRINIILPAVTTRSKD